MLHEFILNFGKNVTFFRGEINEDEKVNKQNTKNKFQYFRTLLKQKSYVFKNIKK